MVNAQRAVNQTIALELQETANQGLPQPTMINDLSLLARQRLFLQRLQQRILWFSNKDKKDGDEQPPKGFEKFFKKNDESSKPAASSSESKDAKKGSDEKAQKKK